MVYNKKKKMCCHFFKMTSVCVFKWVMYQTKQCFSLAVLLMDRWLVHRAPPSCWRAAVSLAPGRTLWWGEWTPGSFPSQWRQCQSSLDPPDYRWTHKYKLNINRKHNKQTNKLVWSLAYTSYCGLTRWVSLEFELESGGQCLSFSNL